MYVCVCVGGGCNLILKLYFVGTSLSLSLSLYIYIYIYIHTHSSVGIATDYGLDGPGSNPGGWRDFPPVQTGAGAHPTSCTMRTGSFPGVKNGRGFMLTPHPLLVPCSRKSKLYLYPPSGPYDLYRASVPVQGCTLPYLCYLLRIGQVLSDSVAVGQRQFDKPNVNIL